MYWFKVVAIVYLSIQVLLAISVILLNGSFLISFAKKRSLHTPSNTVLGCMCCSDMIIGTLSLPLWGYNVSILSSGHIVYDRDFRMSISIAFLACMSLSSLFIMLVNLDRYAAVCHPYKYLQYATHKVYTLISASTLAVYVLIFSIAVVIDKIYHSYMMAIIVITIVSATAIVLLFCTWKIIRVIHRHRREINFSCRRYDGYQSEVKRYNTIKVLVVLFVLCNMPYIIPYTLFVTGMVQASIIFLSFGMLCSLLLLVNCVLNPLVYSFRIRIFRNAIKEVLCCQRPD